MPFYSSVSSSVQVGSAEEVEGWPEGLAGGGMVAVRVADLRSPVRRGRVEARCALVVDGGGRPIRSGELVVLLKPVVVAAAVVGWDGRVQAAGRPAEHVRLGAAETALDTLTGEAGTIDRAVAGVRLAGKVRGGATRVMTRRQRRCGRCC